MANFLITAHTAAITTRVGKGGAQVVNSSGRYGREGRWGSGHGGVGFATKPMIRGRHGAKKCWQIENRNVAHRIQNLIFDKIGYSLSGFSIHCDFFDVQVWGCCFRNDYQGKAKKKSNNCRKCRKWEGIPSESIPDFG